MSAILDRPKQLIHDPHHSDTALNVMRRFNARVAYATTDAEAAAAVAEVIADAGEGLVSVDFETMPNRDAAERLIKLRQQVAAAQGKIKALAKLRAPVAELAEAKRVLKRTTASAHYTSRAGLDPHRGNIRLLQAYGGGRRVLVVDLMRVSLQTLGPLWDRRLVAHNAAFELSFLEKQEIEPAEMHCTMQAVRLLTGVGSEGLSTAAANFLGIDLGKELQSSDWSVSHLTLAQLNYAAADAVVTWHLARKVFPILHETTPAYEIQIAAVPAVVRMQNRGFMLDVPAHAALMDMLTQERAAAQETYADACRSIGRDDLAERGVPVTAAEKVNLLEALLTSEELAAWTRTRKGFQLSTRKAELRRAAHYPPIATLATISTIDKQLTSFGPTLSANVSPVTGRIHASYNVAGANSGRATCSGPNLQQIPRDRRFRALFIAAPGNTLIAADFSSMELRAAAHISDDRVMTQAFERCDDLHRITAARMTNKAPDQVTLDERAAAKRVNFGAAYGMGAEGLVKSAWDAYQAVMTKAEAAAWLRSFAEAFPTFARWRYEHGKLCEERRKIVIGKNAAKGIGRVYHLSWLARERSPFTRACNLPIQGACADAAMLALARIDADLFAAGIDGGPVAWLHDEIVLEVPTEQADLAAELLTKAMAKAFAETFPGTPLRDLVTAHIGEDWAIAKG